MISNNSKFITEPEKNEKTKYPQYEFMFKKELNNNKFDFKHFINNLHFLLKTKDPSLNQKRNDKITNLEFFELTYNNYKQSHFISAKDAMNKQTLTKTILNLKNAEELIGITSCFITKEIYSNSTLFKNSNIKDKYIHKHLKKNVYKRTLKDEYRASKNEIQSISTCVLDYDIQNKKVSLLEKAEDPKKVIMQIPLKEEKEKLLYDIITTLPEKIRDAVILIADSGGGFQIHIKLNKKVVKYKKIDKTLNYIKNYINKYNLNNFALIDKSCFKPTQVQRLIGSINKKYENGGAITNIINSTFYFEDLGIEQNFRPFDIAEKTIDKFNKTNKIKSEKTTNITVKLKDFTKIKLNHNVSIGNQKTLNNNLKHIGNDLEMFFPKQINKNPMTKKLTNNGYIQYNSLVKQLHSNGDIKPSCYFRTYKTNNKLSSQGLFYDYSSKGLYVYDTAELLSYKYNISRELAIVLGNLLLGNNIKFLSFNKKFKFNQEKYIKFKANMFSKNIFNFSQQILNISNKDDQKKYITAQSLYSIFSKLFKHTIGNNHVLNKNIFYKAFSKTYIDRKSRKIINGKQYTIYYGLDITENMLAEINKPNSQLMRKMIQNTNIQKKLKKYKKANTPLTIKNLKHTDFLKFTNNQKLLTEYTSKETVRLFTKIIKKHLSYIKKRNNIKDQIKNEREINEPIEKTENNKFIKETRTAITKKMKELNNDLYKFILNFQNENIRAFVENKNEMNNKIIEIKQTIKQNEFIKKNKIKFFNTIIKKFKVKQKEFEYLIKVESEFPLLKAS